MKFFDYLRDELNLCLNDQQKEAVQAAGKRILLEACPGSGKTTTLITRLAYLVLCKKVNPCNILTLTFNRFTARDMEKRFNELFGNLITQPIRFSTIHSFCYQFLFFCQKKYVLTLPQLLEKQYNRGKIKILKKIYYDINKEHLSEDRVMELSNDIGFVMNKLILPFEYKSNFQSFPSIYQKYQTYKKKKNLMDFDDMLSIALQIISNNKNLYYNYGEFKYVNVDEVQDTSLLQHRIIEEISKDGNLFMVGDIDQSIYSFRGAEPAYILNMQKRFPKMKIHKLETNYRSSKSIVRVSNEFIRQNQLRNSKNMGTNNEEGESPKVIYVKDIKEQVKTTIQLICSGSSAAKTAVLYRNNLSGLPVAYTMLKKGHAFAIRENYSGFFRHFVLDDIISIFKLSADFSDFKSFLKVYYKLGAPIPKIAVESIKNNEVEKKDIFSQLYVFFRYNKFMLDHISRIKKALRRIRFSKPEKALDIIEKELQYEAYMKRNSSSVHVFSLLRYFSRDTKNFSEFIMLLRTLKNGINQYYTRKISTDVSLLTLHGSKGLEFDRVILIDLTEGLLPSEKGLEDLASGDRNTYEEDRRLFYVGITRAVKQLYLLVPERVNGKKMTPSQFIDIFKK